jgi:hypothetical protein
MNQNSFQAITAMLNGFPQSQTADKRALLLTFERALTEVGDPAIARAADRFSSNDVTGQSKTFAPAVAEFVDEARRCQEYLDIKARPRLPAPTAYHGTGSSPFERNRAKALAANAHLPVLFTDVGYDHWRHLSRTKQVPVGGKWVACLGTVYGPEPRCQREAAE